MNFCDPNYQTKASATRFGLCDNGTGGRAFVKLDDPPCWIATVENLNGDHWIFTAVDKGAIQDGEKTGKGRCDGMLTQGQCALILIELKDQIKKWIPHAIQQLEDTVELLMISHPQAWSAFHHKRAYACNKSHPQFQTSHNETRQRFFQKYGVRLHIEATINLSNLSEH